MLLILLVQPVVPACQATLAAQPLLAQRSIGAPARNVSMATAPTVGRTSPAPVHLAGKAPPARRTWPSVPPARASTAALAPKWPVASPAAVKPVGPDPPATRMLMSAPIILAGDVCYNLYYHSKSLNPFLLGMVRAPMLLARTSVLALLAGSAKIVISTLMSAWQVETAVKIARTTEHASTASTPSAASASQASWESSVKLTSTSALRRRARTEPNVSTASTLSLANAPQDSWDRRATSRTTRVPLRRASTGRRVRRSRRSAGLVRSTPAPVSLDSPASTVRWVFKLLVGYNQMNADGKMYSINA